MYRETRETILSQVPWDYEYNYELYLTYKKQRNGKTKDSNNQGKTVRNHKRKA